MDPFPANANLLMIAVSIQVTLPCCAEVLWDMHLPCANHVEEDQRESGLQTNDKGCKFADAQL